MFNDLVFVAFFLAELVRKSATVFRKSIGRRDQLDPEYPTLGKGRTKQEFFTLSRWLHQFPFPDHPGKSKKQLLIDEQLISAAIFDHNLIRPQTILRVAVANGLPICAAVGVAGTMLHAT